VCDTPRVTKTTVSAPLSSVMYSTILVR